MLTKTISRRVQVSRRKRRHLMSAVGAALLLSGPALADQDLSLKFQEAKAIVAAQTSLARSADVPYDNADAAPDTCRHQYYASVEQLRERRDSLKMEYLKLTQRSFDDRGDHSKGLFAGTAACLIGLALAPSSSGLSIAACGVGIGGGAYADAAAQSQNNKVLEGMSRETKGEAADLTAKIEAAEVAYIDRYSVYNLVYADKKMRRYSMDYGASKEIFWKTIYDGRTATYPDQVSRALIQVQGKTDFCNGNHSTTLPELTRLVIQDIQQAPLR